MREQLPKKIVKHEKKKEKIQNRKFLKGSTHKHVCSNSAHNLWNKQFIEAKRKSPSAHSLAICLFMLERELSMVMPYIFFAIIDITTHTRLFINQTTFSALLLAPYDLFLCIELTYQPTYPHIVWSQTTRVHTLIWGMWSDFFLCHNRTMNRDYLCSTFSSLSRSFSLLLRLFPHVYGVH
jgi:hypothetical protein